VSGRLRKAVEGKDAFGYNHPSTLIPLPVEGRGKRRRGVSWLVEGRCRSNRAEFLETVVNGLPNLRLGVVGDRDWEQGCSQNPQAGMPALRRRRRALVYGRSTCRVGDRRSGERDWPRRCSAFRGDIEEIEWGFGE